MANDASELVIALCTRAGMIMEDASVEAISNVPRTPSGRKAVLSKLGQAAQDIQVLIAAAQVVDRRWSD